MATASRIQALERGLQGMAQKMLDAVPISEPWSRVQISSEYRRLHGVVLAPHVLARSLYHLRDIGLVKERDDTYQRITASPKSVQLVAVPSGVDMDAVHTKHELKLSPTDKMANLGTTAREIAKQLNKLADSIDAIAIDVDDQLKQIGEDTAKLRALRELLKG